MEERLLQKIHALERAVHRWKLACLALLLMLLSAMAISATFGIVLMFNGENWREADMARMEADRAREDAQRARAEMQDLLQQLQNAKNAAKVQMPDDPVDP